MYQLVIIDDEPKIAEGMGSLFPWANVGFEVAATFTSAVEAMAYVRSHLVHVVLSDVQMPDLDGVELCRQLENEAVKVVLFSSHQNYEYFRAAIRHSAVDYLLKPVNYSALMECFERLRSQFDEETRSEAEVPAGFWTQVVDDVTAYIQSHMRDATLERAAERVHLSPSYLSRSFKEKSGEGFAGALLRLRMEKAMELLRDPQNKSYDVAYFVGYDNPKNFSRAFKAFYGQTPTEYRKAALGGAEDE